MGCGRGWVHGNKQSNSNTAPPGFDTNKNVGQPANPPNPKKWYHGLDYCWTHEYDMDHNGYNCPNPRTEDEHIPYRTKEMVHNKENFYPRCIRKAKHKVI